MQLAGGRGSRALAVTIETHVSQSAGPNAQTAYSRRQESDRRRIGERRRGQDHGLRQPGGGPGGAGPQDRPDGCRRLRSQRAAHDGDQPDADGLRRSHTAAATVRRQAHVDGLSEPRRQAAGVARSHAALGDPAVPARRRLGRTGLPRDRPAAGDRRRAAFADPERAGFGRDRGHHAVGCLARRCPQGDHDVPPGDACRFSGLSRT